MTHVTVLSRNPERLLDRHPAFSALPWLTFHRGDIEVPESLPRGEDFTHILHAAADSTNVRDLDAWQRYEQITCGTKNLLQFAADRGIRRFLLTSSGRLRRTAHRPRHHPETYHGMPDPLHAANAYGVAKRQAEHLCALYADRFGIEPVIARCFAFVGEDLPLDVHFAIGNFIRDALFRDEITVNGDGSPIRSYMDKAELARWLLVMLRHGEAGRAYNVGGQARHAARCSPTRQQRARERQAGPRARPDRQRQSDPQSLRPGSFSGSERTPACQRNRPERGAAPGRPRHSHAPRPLAVSVTGARPPSAP